MQVEDFYEAKLKDRKVRQGRRNARWTKAVEQSW